MNTQGNGSAASQTPTPEIYLTQLAFGALLSQAVFIAAKLGLADLLAKEPRSIDSLASATNTNGPALYRVMRSLASVGIFEEISQKTFALTPYAEPLRSDIPNSLRNTAIFMGEEWHWRVWGNMIHSVENGKSAWGQVHGLDVFEYFQANPEKYEIFNRAMTDMTSSSAPAIAEAYDFSGVGTLADIAGGHGFLLSTILKANKHLKGILFDLPQVIEGASSLLKKEGVADRVETRTGDFFEAVPAGADIYMMKHIIHDWDDARAIKILRNISEVMNPVGKVLLLEVVVPEGNDPHFAKLMDLEMLVSPGGVERTADEYRQILRESGLRLTRIITTKSPYSIIEAVKEK